MVNHLILFLQPIRKNSMSLLEKRKENNNRESFVIIQIHSSEVIHIEFTH